LSLSPRNSVNPWSSLGSRVSVETRTVLALPLQGPLLSNTHWVDTPLGPGQQPGRAGFPPVIALFRVTLPDLQVTPENVIVSGNKTAGR
jgi:hypothetical protein